MQITEHDIKSYGFAIMVLAAIWKAFTWLTTDKVKVALLEQQLGDLRDQITKMEQRFDERFVELTKVLSTALDKGADRMQRHEDEIQGVRLDIAKRNKS